MRKLINTILPIITLLILSACSFSDSSVWIKTDNDVLIFVSPSDTSKIYRWEGEIIDGIANGDGTLYIVGSGENHKAYKKSIFYGAVSEKDIAKIDGGGKYVGSVIEDKMEGFGVLLLDEDLYIGNFHDSKPDGYLKLYKKGKLYYEGSWKAGAFNGKGILYKEDGTIKSGEWIDNRLIQTFVDVNVPEGHYKGYVKDGIPDGLGQMEYIDSSKYQGFWDNGFWNGKGLYINRKDSVYGVWEKGKVCGDVVYRTPELFFEGTFIDNTPTGIGILTQSDGSYYTGVWVDGKRCGDGDMVFPNGDTYSGEWENNAFHGYGVYEYASENATYSGEWEEGLQNGEGVYTSPQVTYNGEWEKGWMDGDGVFVFSNGDKYEGTVHENLLDGVGHYTFADGNHYVGEFVNGKINGLGVFQFQSGNRFEGEFLDGKIYGDGTMYLVENKDTISITGFWPKDGELPAEASILFPNGDLYEGPIINGAPTETGIWQSGEERRAKLDHINNSAAHKANEFYKKHKETFNKCLAGASAVVSLVQMASASTVIGAPVAGVAIAINVAINVVDASMSIASASIDVMENIQMGEDETQSVKALAAEVGMNVAFILLPKVASSAVKPLGKGVKYITRSPIAQSILNGGKNIVKKSSFKFISGKINGKTIRLSFGKTGRSIERMLVRCGATQKPMIAFGRLMTRFSDQAITYTAFLKKLKSDPELLKNLKISEEGNSSNLKRNMCLLGTDKWFNKNKRIRRYLEQQKIQVEAHHIVPSNPTTESGKKAKEIWMRYFVSVDHPCNGIWVGRKGSEIYKGLAKGSNHSPNSKEYEEYVSNRIISTYNEYRHKYKGNPEKMQEVLAETVDDIKKQIYKGERQIGNKSHIKHTVLSIFTDDSDGA